MCCSEHFAVTSFLLLNLLFKKQYLHHAPPTRVYMKEKPSAEFIATHKFFKKLAPLLDNRNVTASSARRITYAAASWGPWSSRHCCRRHRVDWEHIAALLRTPEPLKREPHVAEIIVWDANTTPDPFARRNIDFRPGAVYVFHEVERLGNFDGRAGGAVQYDVDDANKIREIALPVIEPHDW
ncbi:hypothetical protein L917_16044 [Phytophthora nicotianae]|uniref:Uncharacterized protein n=1 Tax=Phytophthora nicotianae TaxID=4792 RepID=W2KIB1_PHYNI|nr:hypothetical protein L917_16044 [Phytophthora nicotianae]